MASYFKIKRSKIAGLVPNVNQLDTETLVYNEADGLLYAKRINQDLSEEIICIGGGSPPPISSHLRAHQITNPLDHPAVPEADYDKLVATNSTTGAIELISKDIAFTDLVDVIPEDYAGRAKQVPMVVDAEDKLDLVETVLLETVLAKFTLLADCPNSLAGQAGKGIRVNATEDGLEFYTI